MSEAVSSDSSPVDLFERMLLIRAFEEKCAELQAQGQSPSMCTCVGQEASAVGVLAAIESGDLVLSNHRSAGHLLARGAEPGRLLAEILGRATGYCQGRSGSLHVSVRELGVVLTSTIVGGELSLATGVGLSLAMAEEPRVAVCFFGDGAACEGVFHESLNLAAVWNLPVLYVCENNQWQAAVHRREAMLTDEVSKWALGLGVAAKTVDGNDVAAVLAAARAASEYVRESRKPFLLETQTYRLRGHMEPDQQQYVDPGELAYWRGRDPLPTCANALRERGLLSDAREAELRQRVASVIEAATQFALSSPYPSIETLTDNVYA